MLPFISITQLVELSPWLTPSLMSFGPGFRCRSLDHALVGSETCIRSRVPTAPAFGRSHDVTLHSVVPVPRYHVIHRCLPGVVLASHEHCSDIFAADTNSVFVATGCARVEKAFGVDRPVRDVLADLGRISGLDYADPAAGEWLRSEPGSSAPGPEMLM